jgi:hypothetical protein
MKLEYGCINVWVWNMYIYWNKIKLLFWGSSYGSKGYNKMMVMNLSCVDWGYH